MSKIGFNEEQRKKVWEKRLLKGRRERILEDLT